MSLPVTKDQSGYWSKNYDWLQQASHYHFEKIAVKAEDASVFKVLIKEQADFVPINLDEDTKVFDCSQIKQSERLSKGALAVFRSRQGLYYGD